MFTKPQLSDLLQLSPSTIDSYRREGLLPSIKIRGIVHFDINDVSEFVSRHQELPWKRGQ
jgi:DNA-binding transcriptional MerR regulator